MLLSDIGINALSNSRSLGVRQCSTNVIACCDAVFTTILLGHCDTTVAIDLQEHRDTAQRTTHPAKEIYDMYLYDPYVMDLLDHLLSEHPAHG